MKSKTVEVCNAIMRFLVEQGFTNQVTVKEVEKAIVYVRGPDKRTLENWKRALEMLGYLNKKSPFVYEMNLLKVPELLTEAVKGHQKQKKLM